MLQCEDCEYFRRGSDGSPKLMCDPFGNIKEPACLLKWCLTELKVMGQSHQATLDMHRRFAPLQEKLFKHMEKEIDDADESDRWRYGGNDDEDDE